MSTVHIPLQAIKGRGLAQHQPHRFERDAREAFDDGWGAFDDAVSWCVLAIVLGILSLVL